MKVLLVVDLQKQFMDLDGEYDKCLKFIKDSQDDYYIIGTLFKNKENSFYQKQLDYSGCINASLNDIEYSFDELIEKNSYSAMQDGKLEAFLSQAKKLSIIGSKGDIANIEVDVIGCDTDACILATAFDLWDMGENFRILSDYTYTTSKDLPKEILFALLKRNFGKCII